MSKIGIEKIGLIKMKIDNEVYYRFSEYDWYLDCGEEIRSLFDSKRNQELEKIYKENKKDLT
ncbi:hypothetical protein [Empedobacter brevis]|uniref:hypothetical protein n=1 Tax=Empedobacter brevis TaxID=247 RepID=UPI0028D4744A|nr:hypothetical protein [Empedobacter brevis]